MSSKTYTATILAARRRDVEKMRPLIELIAAQIKKDRRR
jgi:hypothetical protein